LRDSIDSIKGETRLETAVVTCYLPDFIAKRMHIKKIKKWAKT